MFDILVVITTRNSIYLVQTKITHTMQHLSLSSSRAHKQVLFSQRVEYAWKEKDGRTPRSLNVALLSFSGLSKTRQLGGAKKVSAGVCEKEARAAKKIFWLQDQ